MLLIVGLGNPGKKYEKTRHNAGFLAINNLRLVIDNCSSWKLDKKFNAEISIAKIGNQKIVLAKPQCFMNNSGQVIKKLTAYYRLPTTSLFIIHDDIDLPLGTIRIRKDGSSAGHKGIQSIIDALGTDQFVRFRIGVDRPSKNIRMGAFALPEPEGRRRAIRMQKFVLKKIKKEEQKLFGQVFEKTSELLIETIEKGVIEKTIKTFC